MLKLALMVLLLVAAFLIWGLWLMRKSRRALLATLCNLDLDMIVANADECRQVFESKLNTKLSFDEYESSAWALDRALKSNATVKAFERVGEHYNYVIKAGCFLGELIRRHSNAAWSKPANKAPNLIINVAGTELKAFPFSKVQKHARSGDEGDLYAYVTIALQGNMPEVKKTPENRP